MGWSCRAEASATMGRITKACVAQTGQQNVYKHGGQKYMWEVNQRIDHKDGSITGTIHKFVSGGIVKAGSFKISGDGTKVTGTGMATLAGASGAKAAVKKERFTLQKYKYGGWNSDTGKPGEIIYVDMANKHPDPMKKLLWGYHKDGYLSHGDFVGFFTKVGKPVIFEFAQTGKYAADEKRVKHAAILRAIKSGRI